MEGVSLERTDTGEIEKSKVVAPVSAPVSAPIV